MSRRMIVISFISVLLICVAVNYAINSTGALQYRSDGYRIANAFGLVLGVVLIIALIASIGELIGRIQKKPAHQGYWNIVLAITAGLVVLRTVMRLL